jgi:hypothetical protein
MTDDLFVIQMNVDHYRALLKLEMKDDKRSVIERLLAEAKADLAQAAERKREPAR